jgi:hypothetical protein
MGVRCVGLHDVDVNGMDVPGVGLHDVDVNGMDVPGVGVHSSIWCPCIFSCYMSRIVLCRLTDGA